MAIAFQPDSFVLASAAEDGLVYLWKASGKGGASHQSGHQDGYQSPKPIQRLHGADEGFTCLAWHPQGTQLVAGGADGELVMWSASKRGSGFG